MTCWTAWRTTGKLPISCLLLFTTQQNVPVTFTFLTFLQFSNNNNPVDNTVLNCVTHWKLSLLLAFAMACTQNITSLPNTWLWFKVQHFSRHAIMAYGRTMVEIHAFCIRDGGQSHTQFAVHWEKVHPVPTGGWVSCRAGQDNLKRKIFSSCQKLNHTSLGIQSAT